jgi:hypothetical protein
MFGLVQPKEAFATWDPFTTIAALRLALTAVRCRDPA